MAINVSVVVPVYNCERTLSDCLIALETQSLSKSDFEVIVVDGGSRDSSVQIARGFGVRLFPDEKRSGSAAGRNTGLYAAQGEWVAFTDGDCVPSRHWLEYLLESVCRTDNGEKTLGAAGQTLGYQSNSAAVLFVDLTGGTDVERYLAHPTYPFPPTYNMMYRRDALASSCYITETKPHGQSNVNCAHGGILRRWLSTHALLEMATRRY